MALHHRTAAAVVLVAVGLLLAAIGALAVAAPAGQDQGPGPPANGTLADLHDAGYTGENVSIGVVDVTGFDRSRSDLAGRVAVARAFGPGATVAQGGRSDHGTAAALVAARTAPDADLYLASFETQGGYQRAVQWLLANDVDVVVAPVSFYGTPGDGSTDVSQVATDAVRQDVVVVASAGNLADSHWRVAYDDVDTAGAPTTGDRSPPGTLVVDGSERNYLRGEGGHVTLWLSWDESTADEEYVVELYRDPHGEGSPERVASSRPFERDDVPNARLEADVESGRYFAVVRGPAMATGTRLRLTSPTHDLARTSERASLAAPATAEGVLAVGAFDEAAGRVEPFSSRGPTVDGRLGLDVVAPARHDVIEGGPYIGTSAAAAYTGGVAALLREGAPGTAPTGIEHALEATALDVGRPGPDPASGFGRIDAYRAVTTLANATG